MKSTNRSSEIGINPNNNCNLDVYDEAMYTAHTCILALMDDYVGKKQCFKAISLRPKLVGKWLVIVSVRAV